MQRLLSSPERHALLRKANAKERAVRAPSFARPAVARVEEEEGSIGAMAEKLCEELGMAILLTKTMCKLYSTLT